MFFSILTLVVAIAISGIAAWYSIVGLMAIFASAAIPIAIMGGVLEVGKLVTASWLYHNWKESPKFLKIYLTSAVIVLMFITSMGIFGFLSKAHIDQTLVGGDNSLEIQSLDQQITNEQRKIKDAQILTEQLDDAVRKLIEYDRIRGATGAVALRKKQAVERSLHSGAIHEASQAIKRLRDERIILAKKQLKVEAEVGPIKYIAELFYDGKANNDILAKAVRWVIITIIFVFDPLAILLLLAANMGFRKKKKPTLDLGHAVPVEPDYDTVQSTDGFGNKSEYAFAGMEVSDQAKAAIRNGGWNEEDEEAVMNDAKVAGTYTEPYPIDDDPFASVAEIRERQNRDALKKQGTFGPTEK